jgi:uncharacterized protein (TIGR02453 family)
MLQPETLKFLKLLKNNNDRLWFAEHKTEYLHARADFELLVQQLIDGLCSDNPYIEGLQLKDSVFRIYRDVRFSADKTPYNSHFSAWIGRGGRKGSYAGYYIHISPGKSYLAGGIYMPPKEVLKNIRQEIDYNYAEFVSIIGNKLFIKTFGTVKGDSLKKEPAGYDSNHPAMAYLKLKSLIISHPLPDELIVQPTLLRDLLKTFKLMQPFIHFLNAAQENGD